MRASRRMIKETAKLAVQRVTGGTYKGMCDPISIELCKLLHAQGVDTQGIASTYFLGEHPHYVSLISGNQVVFTDAHQIIVDPTILQFEDELQEIGIENVYETHIITTGDNEWVDWYQKLEPINDKRLSK